MHKAFINDKPLIFADVYSENHDDKYSIFSDSQFTIDDLIKEFDKKETSGIIYLSSSPQNAWNSFLSRYILMEAAGGLVVNPSNEFLIIYRRKHWDLPKGKLEYNESPEAGALREVREECGIKELNLEKFLLKTFHTYSEKNKFILKKTHWYEMSSPGTEKLIPQTEEDIDKVKWMSKDQVLDKVFSKTYESIKDVFNQYFELIR